MALADAATFDWGRIASRQVPFFEELRLPNGTGPRPSRHLAALFFDKWVPASFEFSREHALGRAHRLTG